MQTTTTACRVHIIQISHSRATRAFKCKKAVRDSYSKNCSSLQTSDILSPGDASSVKWAKLTDGRKNNRTGSFNWPVFQRTNPGSQIIPLEDLVSIISIGSLTLMANRSQISIQFVHSKEEIFIQGQPSRDNGTGVGCCEAPPEVEAFHGLCDTRETWSVLNRLWQFVGDHIPNKFK